MPNWISHFIIRDMEGSMEEPILHRDTEESEIRMSLSGIR